MLELGRPNTLQLNADKTDVLEMVPIAVHTNTARRWPTHPPNQAYRIDQGFIFDPFLNVEQHTKKLAQLVIY